MITTIVSGLVLGLVVGPLGRLVLPGKQDVSLLMTIVIGAVAAIAGGVVARLLGVGDTPGIDWMQLAIQVALAAGGVALYVGKASKS